MSDRSKTMLSLLFLVSVAGTLAIYAFVFAQSKSSLSDVEGMFGCLAIGWIVGFVFYRLNVFGVKNYTPRAEAALVGWTTKSGNGVLALLIRKAAVAVLIGALLAFAILFWVSHLKKSQPGYPKMAGPIPVSARSAGGRAVQPYPLQN